MKTICNIKFSLNKFLSSLLILSILVFIPSVSLAEDVGTVQKKEETITALRDNGGTYYTKTVQKTWQEWSEYRRVSNNVVVKSGETMSIQSTDSVTFSADIKE